MPPSSDPWDVQVTPWPDQVAWASPGAGEPVPRQSRAVSRVAGFRRGRSAHVL